MTVSGAEAQNYDISYVAGTLFVTEDAVVIIANNYTRKYGDANPTFDYTSIGSELKGTPLITCSASETSPVGTYDIIVSQGTVSNYSIVFVAGTLTIEPAPLTITAKSYVRKQGEANPDFEVTYQGFKNGETESVLIQKPTVSTTATIYSPIGTYDINVFGAEAQNYSFNYIKGTLTVIESDQVKFTLQGITYIGTLSTLTAEVQSVNENLVNVELPSSVYYNGKNYQVTSIANAALSNRIFNYVELPSTVTGINEYTFYGSELGALIWNASTSVPTRAFWNTKMPTDCNFLLYVKNSNYAPQDITNVIVNNAAQSIRLSDKGNVFFCPRQFTANSISYTHRYSQTTGNGKGWETLALPFKVQSIEHGSKGKLTPFALYDRSDDTQRPFWLYSFSTSGFVRANSIEENKPYIIAMPNSTAYDEEYNLPGDVTFSATNVTIPVTPPSMGVQGDKGMTFRPVYNTVEASSEVYVLNAANSRGSYTGGYLAGSRFIRDLRSVYPFEAYLTTASADSREVLSIPFADESTAIDMPPLNTMGSSIVRIYSLTGSLLMSVERSEQDKAIHQLPSGVYIVDGRSVMVR